MYSLTKYLSSLENHNRGINKIFSDLEKAMAVVKTSSSELTCRLDNLLGELEMEKIRSDIVEDEIERRLPSYKEVKRKILDEVKINKRKNENEYIKGIFKESVFTITPHIDSYGNPLTIVENTNVCFNDGNRCLSNVDRTILFIDCIITSKYDVYSNYKNLRGEKGRYLFQDCEFQNCKELEKCVEKNILVEQKNFFYLDDDREKIFVVYWEDKAFFTHFMYKHFSQDNIVLILKNNCLDSIDFTPFMWFYNKYCPTVVDKYGLILLDKKGNGKLENALKIHRERFY